MAEPTFDDYEEASNLFEDDFRIRDLARLLARLRVAESKAIEAERARQEFVLKATADLLDLVERIKKIGE